MNFNSGFDRQMQAKHASNAIKNSNPSSWQERICRSQRFKNTINLSEISDQGGGDDDDLGFDESYDLMMTSISDRLRIRKG